MAATLWLIGLPLITSPIVYLAGHINARRPALARWFGLAGLLAAWAVFVQVASDVNVNGAITTQVALIALRVDGISHLDPTFVVGFAALRRKFLLLRAIQIHKCASDSIARDKLVSGKWLE